MKYRFFQIPAQNSEAEAERLNAFLSSHRVVHVDRHFVADGANSYWALAVSWLDGAAAPNRPGKEPRVDYRQVLDDADFQVYARLREIRKQLAEEKGLPAYALFTNQQLASLVLKRVTSARQMLAIEGIGKGKCEQFGPAFLTVLKEVFALNNGTNQGVGESHGKTERHSNE
ncbi:HRDC domain-containing protein [Sulfidibacter corallicola]|uniref:HRDC domain-containing protein n=1 Tax=Sulfidibacter corallicola TaxID=2818388 RepID=A0A8A4TF52_SULCO|nr:HRDC domain-containing protein [Sulfidibacter corallicola]QTD48576.1 HRDC domain-containing protein [Sulfidibacter corallicola]